MVAINRSEGVIPEQDDDMSKFVKEQSDRMINKKDDYNLKISEEIIKAQIEPKMKLSYIREIAKST